MPKISLAFVFVLPLVQNEYVEKVDSVQNSSERAIIDLSNNVSKMDRFAKIHGVEREVHIGHWQEYVGRCRVVADRWMGVGVVQPGSKAINERAFARVLAKRSPSRRGKESIKDCIILETYLDCIRTFREGGFAGPVVFVSSNTSDFASETNTVVSEDLIEEFRSIRLEYASNMAAAKNRLSL